VICFSVHCCITFHSFLVFFGIQEAVNIFNDEDGSRKLMAGVTELNIASMETTAKECSQFTCRDLQAGSDISLPRFFPILHSQVFMRKVQYHWVPLQLTVPKTNKCEMIVGNA
jgi:hypothetical protein